MNKNLLGLFGWLALTFAVSFIASRFTPGEWYSQLAKPSFTPPSWIFGPVWTLLYALMAIAAWTVWKNAGFKGASVALSLFVLQLILNGLWSGLFFGLQRPDLAFYEIIFLWIIILLTLVVFWKHQPLAGVLFIPYIAWVSFAAVLNFYLWRMNV